MMYVCQIVSFRYSSDKYLHLNKITGRMWQLCFPVMFILGLV
jgi:hypothetical protein